MHNFSVMPPKLRHRPSKKAVTEGIEYASDEDQAPTIPGKVQRGTRVTQTITKIHNRLDEFQNIVKNASSTTDKSKEDDSEDDKSVLCAKDTKRPKRSSAKEPSKGKPPPPSAAEESEDEQSDASAQDTKRVKPSSAVGSSRLSAATPPVSRSASASLRVFVVLHREFALLLHQRNLPLV